MHRIRSTRTRLLILPLAAVFALGACGGDDDSDDAAAGSDDDTTTTAAESSQPAETTGSGEIVLAGQTYAFTSDECSIGDEDVPLIAVKGTGNTGGREYTVDISRSQPASNYVERVTLAWSASEGSVTTKIGPEADVLFEVEDNKATASALSFVGGGKAPSGEGSATFSCGA